MTWIRRAAPIYQQFQQIARGRGWRRAGFHAAFFSVLIGLTAHVARGQEQSFEGRTVESVAYQPASQPIDPADLDRLQSVRLGSPLRAGDVAATIDRLFASGHYQDIQVDAQPAADGGVAIRFLTEPVYFIGHIEIAGKVKDPPNRGQMVSETQLSLGAPFDPAAVVAARESIQQLLTANGLYESTVEAQTKRDDATQQVEITFRVDEGKRARYTQPQISGDTKLSDSTIIRATGWRVRLINRWRTVTQALTDSGVEGVRKKYQSKDRLTATVELRGMRYDEDTRRVQPSLAISAGPKFTVKALEAKVSKSRLRRYVPVYQEGAVDNDLLVEGARNLRDHFQSRGYPDVDVTFRRSPLKNDAEEIDYFITRGERRKLVRLDFQGVHYFREQTLRERIFLTPASLQLRYGRFSEAFLAKDKEAITNLYRANGFRDANVTATILNNFRGKSNQIAVTFKVNEGEQWTIARLQTEGMDPESRQRLLPVLASAQGQPFSEVNVGSDRNAIVSEYLARGYPRVAFQWSASPGTAPQTVTLLYRVTPGPHEFVRRVLVSGIRFTKPKLVSENLTIKPGDPLSLVSINEAQRRLYELGVFARIDTAVQGGVGGDAERRYVLYDFDEANRYTLNLGVGAEVAQIGGTTSNVNSPTGATGFSPRFSLDARRLNTWGIGHTVSISGRFSSLQQRASVNYLIPRFLNSPNRSLTISGIYDLSRDVRTFSSKREEFNVQLSQKLSKGTTAFVRFAYRNVSTTNVVIPTLLVPQLVQPVRIGILSVNVVQDHRDNPSDAHRGVYTSVDLGVAPSAFGSQRQFVRGLVRNATYKRLTGKLVLARQLTFGVIEPIRVVRGFSQADTIPLPERFFGGGPESHRGFAQNQAGPRDIGAPVGPTGIATVPTGFPLGGNAILFHNTELRFPLVGDNIGGVLFHDIGNVYRTLGDISFRYTQKNNRDFNYAVNAVGFGVRYRTPIGPLRGDISYALNPPRYQGFSGTQRQLLTCNPQLPPSQLPSYCQSTPQRISHVQFFFSIGQTF